MIERKIDFLVHWWAIPTSCLFLAISRKWFIACPQRSDKLIRIDRSGRRTIRTWAGFYQRRTIFIYSNLRIYISLLWPSPFCYFGSWTNLFATAIHHCWGHEARRTDRTNEPHLIIKVTLREHNIAEENKTSPVLCSEFSNNNHFTSVRLFRNLFNFIIIYGPRWGAP